MNEYQKTFDLCLKIFVYGCVALYFSLTWKGWIRQMRITTYQQNAKMLSEAHRVIHEQNMKRLAELTRQAEHQQKVQEIKTQWARLVDVKV